MPSVLTHFALLDKIVERAPQQSSAIIQQNLASAYWGSVGPDYLFFAPDDWGPLEDFFRFIFDVQNDIGEIVKAFREVESYVGSAQDFVTGGAHSAIKQTAAYLKATFASHLAQAVSDQFDLFSLVESPTQKNRPVEEWWWMDVCHNLRTGNYARNLWNNSRGNNLLESYAYGYLTHMAGDAIVHPYVNLISGGPYRLHARRHILVEKAFDTYILDKWYAGLRVSDCNWHEKIIFDRTAPYPNLPPNLTWLIHKSLEDTYGDLGIQSGVPSEEDINLMYRFFFFSLKGTTAMGWLNLGPPNFDLVDMPDEIRQIFQTPPPPISFPSDLTSITDWSNFIKSLFEFLKWAVETLFKLAYVGISIIAQLYSAPFRYFLWLLQKMLYDIYLNSRLLLSLGGFLHPAKSHLDFFTTLTNPDINWLREQGNRFPFQKYTTPEQSYHLVFPNVASSEAPQAHPFSLHPTNVPLQNVPTSAFFDVQSPLIGDAPSAPLDDPLGICGQTGSANLRAYVENANGFVSARTFALELFRDFEQFNGMNVPNLNLDGDRGYLWPSWASAETPGSWTDASFQFNCR